MKKTGKAVKGASDPVSAFVCLGMGLYDSGDRYPNIPWWGKVLLCLAVAGVAVLVQWCQHG